MQAKQLQFTISFLTALIVLTAGASLVIAQSGDDIEDRIEETSGRIEQLDDEINELSGELEHTHNEAATLEEAVNDLDSSVQRLSGQVNQTQSSITVTQQEIAEIEDDVSQIEQNITTGRAAIARMVRILNQAGKQTLVETLLASNSLADAWGRADQLTQIQAKVQNDLKNLRESKEQLLTQQEQEREKQAELVDLRKQQADQQAIIESQKQEKAELLAATNQEASQYQQLIARKQAQKEAFEAELRQFEEQLNSTASTGSVPEGAGQFVWPVSPVRITQQFGGTAFAKRNPQVYGRAFHNGTDFGVPVGTPVGAVAAGTIRATGNTDAISGCYSYGKWVLIDHSNGLSTLYAHLSQIAATPGQSVAQGGRIGYSGNTGYSTGPHLHLTTYIQQDVQVIALGEVKTRTNCAAAEMPVAPLESYLDSMTYLP